MPGKRRVPEGGREAGAGSRGATDPGLGVEFGGGGPCDLPSTAPELFCPFFFFPITGYLQMLLDSTGSLRKQNRVPRVPPLAHPELRVYAASEPHGTAGTPGWSAEGASRLRHWIPRLLPLHAHPPLDPGSASRLSELRELGPPSPPRGDPEGAVSSSTGSIPIQGIWGIKEQRGRVCVCVQVHQKQE